MKVNLQFTVNCSKCTANGVYNSFLSQPTPFSFEQKMTAAYEYFEKTNWRRLPSGTWICRKVHERRNAA